MADSTSPIPRRRSPNTTTEDGDDLLDGSLDLGVSTTESGKFNLRRLPMTVVKYNQWTVIDANREQGVQVREEEAALQRRRAESTAAYHEARSKRTAVGRGQQEFTANAVREYRGTLAKAGEQGRAELMQLRAIAMRQRKEWAAHGARSAAINGLEQKKRVLEAKAERFQARRNAALQTKQETAMRLQQRKLAEEQEGKDKAARLARARANTPTPESLAEAREFFAKQKRDVAAEVKRSVRQWDSARRVDAEKRMQKAKDNHSVVYATRHEASKNRNEIKESRNHLARRIRESLRDMEQVRRDKIESAKEYVVESHRQNFERKFVSAAATERAESSEYAQLVQRMRYPNLSLSELSSAVLPSTASSVPVARSQEV